MSHRRFTTLFIFLFISLFFRVDVTAQEATAAPVADPPLEGQLYTPMVFGAVVDHALYENPFDDEDIEVIGIFQPPSGEQQIARGFWMQPYVDRCPECAVSELEPQGDPIWQVRFTPTQVGQWSYQLQVRDAGVMASTQRGQFEVSPSDQPGFIYVGRSGRYFQYDNGDPYFPVGHNLNYSWDAVGGLRTYLRWLRELSEAGGNYARLFIDTPWFISLDWNGPPGDYRESQRAAAMLDLILQAAAEYGVSLQIVLLWHQSMQIYDGPPVNIPEQPPRPQTNADWDGHSYNVLNGGPLSGPGVFLYDEQAQALFQRRLRYIAARWGSSPQVFAWELIDRIDRVSNFQSENAARWLQRMTSYLREQDIYDHLITAGSADLDLITAANPLLDFRMMQFYQRRPIEAAPDQVNGTAALVDGYLQLGPAPALLANFSLNPWFEPLEDDPLGVHVQTTMWAAALSGAAGGAMSDWWHTYIVPQALSHYYGPLAAFAAGVDWPNLDLRSASAALLSVDGTNYAPVRIDQFNRQFAARLEDVVTHNITADGVFPPVDTVPSFLYGQVFNSQFSQVQRYTITVPAATYLEVGVRAVSPQAEAGLVITLDNAPAAQVVLRAETTDAAVRVPLSAGEHTITLENSGDDWLELDYLEIGQLIAPARALTLRDPDAGVALAWIQHRDYTWQQVNAGQPRSALEFQYRLNGMPAGRYVVEIWDPLVGAVLGEELLSVGADSVLTVNLPPMNSQLALRAVRQGDLVPSESASPQTITTATAAPPSPTARPTITLQPALAQTNTPRPTEAPIS